MKKRLDVLLVERGLSPGRDKAKRQIMAGEVYVAGQKEDKPGSVFAEDVAIEVRGPALRYVSRGGLKLEKAVAAFALDLSGYTCMDIGASTGGFTDCMLQNGAVKVFAVDVGYGQLAYRLREDPRVVCMEKTNIRYVTREDIGEELDFASIDVSFISLTLVLPVAMSLLKENGSLVCLIKPQFEAGREKVGKKGVIKDPAVHREVIEKVATFSLELGFLIRGLTFSPVKGPEGNIEYLLYLSKDKESGEAKEDREKVSEVRLEVEEREKEAEKEKIEEKVEEKVEKEGQVDKEKKEKKEKKELRREDMDRIISQVVEEAHQTLDAPGGGA